MKNSIIILIILFLALPGFSQEQKYSIRSASSRQITQEKILGANTLSDICQGYPSTWISDYISTKIQTTQNGKSLVASGSDEVLSVAQKNILQAVDAGTDIGIYVSYRNRNPVTDVIQENNLHFSITLKLRTEAMFIGGAEKMNQYFSEKSINQIALSEPNTFKGALVSFTVDAEGKVIQAKVTQSSGNAVTDDLLLKAINKMPRWKPATGANGKKVAQQFVFSLGGDGC